MVRNTSKPLEGLKTFLFHLFSPDEVRQSSLKGRTTVAGGETVGLQKENLDLIYCKFKIDVTYLSIVCETHEFTIIKSFFKNVLTRLQSGLNSKLHD